MKKLPIWRSALFAIYLFIVSKAQTEKVLEQNVEKQHFQTFCNFYTILLWIISKGNETC